MWIVCITSVRHVLTVNGYGGRQTKENEKSWCFKGWETLVFIVLCFVKLRASKCRCHSYMRHLETVYALFFYTILWLCNISLPWLLTRG